MNRGFLKTVYVQVYIHALLENAVGTVLTTPATWHLFIFNFLSWHNH